MSDTQQDAVTDPEMPATVQADTDDDFVRVERERDSENDAADAGEAVVTDDSAVSAQASAAPRVRTPPVRSSSSSSSNHARVRNTYAALSVDDEDDDSDDDNNDNDSDDEIISGGDALRTVVGGDVVTTEQGRKTAGAAKLLRKKDKKKKRRAAERAERAVAAAEAKERAAREQAVAAKRAGKDSAGNSAGLEVEGKEPLSGDNSVRKYGESGLLAIVQRALDGVMGLVFALLLLYYAVVLFKLQVPEPLKAVINRAAVQLSGKSLLP